MSDPKPCWSIRDQGSALEFTCSARTEFGGLVQYSGKLQPDASAGEIAGLLKDLELRVLRLVKAERPVWASTPTPIV